MAIIKVIVEGEEYKIYKRSESLIFTIEHSSGTHLIGYKSRDKKWDYHSRSISALPIDIDKIGKHIEEHFDID
jgi:hypothetical protein